MILHLDFLLFVFLFSLCVFYYPRQPHTGVYHIRIVCLTSSFTPAIGVENRRYALYLADISLRAFYKPFFFQFLFVFLYLLYFFHFIFSCCIGSWEQRY